MPEPKMRVGRSGFLPDVLRNDRFTKVGILFGEERFGLTRLRWAVIDPRRHVMFTWRKASTSFVASARALDASLFTNGPFMDYPHGSFARSLREFGSDTTRTVLAHRLRLRGNNHKATSPLWEKVKTAQVRHLQATAPLGFVIGRRERISETRVSRPRLQWFGRGPGIGFHSYRIGRGDPVGVDEAVGGLFCAVRDYLPDTVDQFARVGYWALAPLSGDRALECSGVQEAADEYDSRCGWTEEETGRCVGLVLLITGWSSTQRLAELMCEIRVKDAVQFDGGDSLMLGAQGSLMIGSGMSPWKRSLQCWGIQFLPSRGGLVPSAAHSDGGLARSESPSSTAPVC